MKSTAASVVDAAAARKRIKAEAAVRNCAMRALLLEHYVYICDRTERHRECGLDVALWTEEGTKIIHYRVKNDKGLIEWVYLPKTHRIKALIKEGDITDHLTFSIALLVGVLIRLRIKHVIH